MCFFNRWYVIREVLWYFLWSNGRKPEVSFVPRPLPGCRQSFVPTFFLCSDDEVDLQSDMRYKVRPTCPLCHLVEKRGYMKFWVNLKWFFSACRTNCRPGCWSNATGTSEMRLWSDDEKRIESRLDLEPTWKRLNMNLIVLNTISSFVEKFRLHWILNPPSLTSRYVRDQMCMLKCEPCKFVYVAHSIKMQNIWVDDWVERSWISDWTLPE